MSGEGQAAVLTNEQVKVLRSVVKEQTQQPERNLAMIAMSFQCGLRVKEICSLYVQDVIDSKGKLRESFKLASTQTKKTDKKESNSREVFLTNPKLRKDLEAYLKVRGKEDGPLFISRKKGAMTPNSMQMAFKKMYTTAEIKGASSHSGRRTFATRLIEKGVDVVLVSRMMGHASIEMTRKYVQDNPDKKAKAAMDLDII